MRVVVNGSPREVREQASIADVVSALGRDPAARGTAVALNGEVVPRAEWGSTTVSEDARVEVLTAVQGG
jgi:sulfur carrier protein